MGLISMIDKKYNEDLRKKVADLAQEISQDFLFLVGHDVIEHDSDHNWIINEKYLGKFIMGDSGDYLSFRFALKENYSKTKRADILEIHKSALITCVTCRNLALDYIKKENFASAMDKLIIFSEAIGFLRSQSALSKIKGYFDQERIKKQNAAKSRYPYKEEIIKIIYSTSKKYENKFKSLDKLIAAIEHECEMEISKNLGETAKNWKDGGFVRMVHNLRRSNSSLNEKLKGLLFKNQPKQIII